VEGLRVEQFDHTQDKHEGERYFFTERRFRPTERYLLREFSDPAAEDRLYDRIRALEFPPHEPTDTTIRSEKVYRTPDLETHY